MIRSSALALVTGVLLLVGAAAPAAQAAEQPVDFFGGDGTLGGQFQNARGVAVNEATGDVYVSDTADRVERFHYDGSSYSFVSAWGAGVDASVSGSGFEVCTVATNCQAGTASAGNGAVSFRQDSVPGVAVDQATGDVYVADPGNLRVNVYSASGAFLQSMGFGVDATTGGTGYQVCPAADSCRAGVSGSAPGQLATPPDPQFGFAIAVSPVGAPGTRALYVADPGNQRIEVWPLDGSAPSSIGSAATFVSGRPYSVAVDARGIVYAGNGDAGFDAIDRYDTTGVDGAGVGFLAPIPTGEPDEQQLTVSATAGTYTLTFTPPGGGAPQTTGQLSFDSSAHTVEQALAALPGIGVGNVQVTGGPGDASGSHPYTILFRGALDALVISQLTAANGSSSLSGGTGASVSNSQGRPGAIPGSGGKDQGLSVDPSTGALYSVRDQDGPVQQWGPNNPPGLLAPPTADDGRHGTVAVYSDNGFATELYFSVAGVAVDPSDGRLYLASRLQVDPSTMQVTPSTQAGVTVLGVTGPPPTASLDSCDPPGTTQVTCHATINPNGPPESSYHFEYSTDDVNWSSTPPVALGQQTTAQSVSGTIDGGPAGLHPNTLYHLRVVAQRFLALPVISNELTATTASAAPIATTTGAPFWSATTAQLTGRLVERNAATTYHFEYGTSTAYGQSTPDRPAPSDDSTHLVSEQVSGLAAGTTYHFRLVADNGTPGSSATGVDMTVTTRASDAPLSHGSYPGPPGSDRAYELVSVGDSSGNPISRVRGLADNGDAASYGIAGGSSVSDTASFFGAVYAERPPGAHPSTGWRSRSATPPRSEQEGFDWYGFFGAADLSANVAYNDSPGAVLGLTGPIWRLSLTGAPQRLFVPQFQGQLVSFGNYMPFVVSADGSRVVAGLEGGSLDPAYPAAATQYNLYDVSQSPPRLASLLPGPGGGAPAACGAAQLVGDFNGGTAQIDDPVSADGSLLFFLSQGNNCSAPREIYVRDFATHTSTLVSGPALSGPLCDATFLKGTPGAAFFATATRLDPADSAPTGCTAANENIYRYDTGTGAVRCLTCLVPGVPAQVVGGNRSTLSSDGISISDDGSRLYFAAMTPLLAGAPPGSVYRLDVASGALAAVPGATIGDYQFDVNLSPDGRYLAFASSDPVLNPLGPAGTPTNAGTRQYYLYDDGAGSVTCVSCPGDGSAPLDGVLDNLTGDFADISDSPNGPNALPNVRALSATGTFAFATDTGLLPADHNSAPADPARGADVYEYRDGRLLLVSDGSTAWDSPSGGTSNSSPGVAGITPSGDDLFFTASAQYTPDAVDASARLWDARIGGGIDFPTPPPGCSGDGCYNPAAPPAAPVVATISFTGPGNVVPPPPVARITLSGRKLVTGTRFAVRVKVPGAGVITASGGDVRGVRRQVARAGTYTLTFSLTRAAVRALRRRHSLRITVRVAFAPAGGAVQRATLTLGLREPPRHKRKRAHRAQAAIRDRGASR